MNYYEILKIARNASKQQIKNSYKKLVKQYHPDLYMGDKDFAEQKIKEINEAYAILSHPEKKLEYDEYLNLTIEPPSVSTSPAKNNSPNTHYNTSQSPSQSSFSTFITEKFNKLDKKRQVQIFLIILLLILALFLMNLIEVKYYLNNTIKDTPKDTKIPTNSSENNTITQFQEPDESYDFDTPASSPQDEWKIIDDLFYDYLFKPYENPTENDFETIY